MNGDEASIERPGAYGHIVRLQCVKKFWGLFDWGGEIGIRKQNGLTARFKHPVTHAETLPTIHTVGNHPQGWKRLSKGFSHFRGAIFRPIVDDENFRLPSQRRQDTSAIRSSVAGRRSSSL